jgi:YegS/Rv2252/BmrU family lipid kinase
VKKTVVVVNPRSQNGALGRRWPEIARTIGRELGGFEHVMTEGPRDATRLAREALEGGADTVVAIGGDGTIQEVANGFFVDGRPVRPGAALGVIPFGTGGDFRKTIPIPNDLAGAAAILKAGATRTIDVGRLTYRAGGRDGDEATCIFVNIASFGIAGLVDQIANSSSKWMGGGISFFLATARAAMRYKNQRVRIILDEKDDEPLDLTINNVAVANGRYFGGGMHVAPEAALDDGVFDVIAIGDVTTLEMLKNGSKIYRGTHLGLPKVTARKAHKVEARALDDGAEVLLDVDGEALGSLPATFEILPAALPLVAPA